MVNKAGGNLLAHYNGIWFLVSGLVILLPTSIFNAFCLAMNPGRLKTVRLHHSVSSGHQLNLGQCEAHSRQNSQKEEKFFHLSFPSVFFLVVDPERDIFLHLPS